MLWINFYGAFTLSHKLLLWINLILETLESVCDFVGRSRNFVSEDGGDSVSCLFVIGKIAFFCLCISTSTVIFLNKLILLSFYYCLTYFINFNYLWFSYNQNIFQWRSRFNIYGGFLLNFKRRFFELWNTCDRDLLLYWFFK
jgi:hypothetical protein